jgi:hypothetical protein
VGAQGLMQVIDARPSRHEYEAFGGSPCRLRPDQQPAGRASQVLHDCVRRAGGSLQEGLRLYVGAAMQRWRRGYVSRVMAEQARRMRRAPTARRGRHAGTAADAAAALRTAKPTAARRPTPSARAGRAPPRRQRWPCCAEHV